MENFIEILQEECERVVEEYRMRVSEYLEITIRDLEQELDLEDGDLLVTHNRVFYNGVEVFRW